MTTMTGGIDSSADSLLLLSAAAESRNQQQRQRRVRRRLRQTTIVRQQPRCWALSQLLVVLVALLVVVPSPPPRPGSERKSSSNDPCDGRHDASTTGEFFSFFIFSCAQDASPAGLVGGAAATADRTLERANSAIRNTDSTTTTADSVTNKKPQSLNEILLKAGRRGLGGGIPGAMAGVIQVVTLMWLRTIMNYQCRYGTSFFQALRTLLNDGGVGRLYRGLGFALVQAPVSRFVSTASNDGVEALLGSLNFTKEWGPGRTTVVASFVVGFARILLMRTFAQ